MTEESKAFQVFQSGLKIRIYNDIIITDHRFDIKMFWEHVDDKNNIIKSCKTKGFTNLDDCLDNCSKYVKKYKKDNPIKTENINFKIID